jgi:ankyrin repeat protein
MPLYFSKALKQKNFDVMHGLLNESVKPIPVDIRSKEFKTGLMLACSYKDPKTVGVFLNKGAKLELTDMDDGWTALHYASQSGCQESAKQLMDKGANIEARTNINETPLHLAAQNNNLEVVKMLIEFKANIRARSNIKETPLHLAIKNKSLDVAKLLIGKGAYLNARTTYGATTIHLACQKGLLEIVEQYAALTTKEERAKGDVEGKYPIHYAAEEGFDGVVDYLLDKMEYDVNQTTYDGKTALQFALEKNHLQVIKVLLRFHATINEQDREILSKIDEDEIKEYLLQPTRDNETLTSIDSNECLLQSTGISTSTLIKAQ